MHIASLIRILLMEARWVQILKTKLFQVVKLQNKAALTEKNYIGSILHVYFKYTSFILQILEVQ